MRNLVSTKSIGFNAFKTQYKDAIYTKRTDVENGDQSDLYVDDTLQRLNTVAYASKWRHKESNIPSKAKINKKRPISQLSSNTITVNNSDSESDEEYDEEYDEKEEQTLQGPTLYDIVREITKIYTQAPYRDAKVFVMSFDKSKFVPAAKSEEQEKRQKNSKVNIGELKPINFKNINEPIPNFSDYLQDRKGWRKRIIKWLCWQMLSPTSEFAITPSIGKSFIIDGHQFNLSELGKIKGICGLNNIQTDSDAYVIPIMVLSTRNPSGGGKRIVQIQANCANTIGEGDHIPYFWLNHYTSGLTTTKNNKLEIISIDCDSVYLSIVYLYNVRKSYEVTGRDLKDIPRIIIQKKTPSKIEFIHINRLYDEILRKCINPIDLMIVMFTAGTDYTDSHYFVPYKNFLTAYYTNHKLIGPLFIYDYESLAPPLRKIKFDENIDEEEKPKSDKNQKELFDKFHSGKAEREFYKSSEYFPDGWILADDFSINPKSYTKLLLYAYYNSFQSRFTEVEISGLNPSNINYYLNGSSGKKALSQNKHFPGNDDLTNSFLQLIYYLRIVMSNGLPKITQNSPLKYGYEKRDVTKIVAPGNIRRIRD